MLRVLIFGSFAPSQLRALGFNVFLTRSIDYIQTVGGTGPAFKLPAGQGYSTVVSSSFLVLSTVIFLG